MPVWPQAFDLPEIPRCTQLTPGAASGDFTPSSLNLRVVLDGVSQADGARTVAKALGSYLPQNIFLSASYDTANFKNSDGGELIEELKRFYGGKRPDGVHLVYALTDKDLHDGGAFGDSLAGLADCIGGVAYPENAFAIGESDPRIAAEVLAHELGHLLGAHHHYANCVESLPNGGARPCTLMFNDVGFAGLPFSSINGAVVRGHSQIFGQPEVSASASSGGGGGGSPSGLALLILAGLGLSRRLLRPR